MSGTTPSTAGLKLTITGGNFCPAGGGGVNALDMRADGDFATVKPDPGQDVTAFTITGSGAVAGIGQYREADTYCLANGANYSKTVNITAAMLHAVDPSGGRYPGVYYVEINAKVSTARNGIDNNFTLSENGTPGGNQSVVAAAQTDGIASPKYNFTFRNGNAAYQSTNPTLGSWDIDHSSARDYNNSYSSKFGADCSVADADGGTKSTQITLYDADYINTAASGQLKTLLVKTDKFGQTAVLTGNYYSRGVGGTNGTWQNIAPSAANATQVPTGGNDDSIYINFQANAGDKYQFYLVDVRPDLINQIGIPFDGFYYTAPCPPITKNTSANYISAVCTDPGHSRQTFNFRYFNSVGTPGNPVKARVIDLNARTNVVVPTSITPSADGKGGSGSFTITQATADASRYELQIKHSSLGASWVAIPAPDGRANSVNCPGGVIAATCNIAVSAGNYLEPTDPYTVTVTGTVTDTLSSATIDKPLYVTLNSPNPAPAATSGSGNNLSATYISEPQTAPATTGTVHYDGTIQYVVHEGAVTKPGSASCTGDIQVAELPYLKVYGGDVEAGYGASSAGGTCQAAAGDGKIVSWNRGSTALKGAGAEFGVQANDIVKGFVSGQSINGSGYDYSFANTTNRTTGASKYGDSYGGNFGATPTCVDYTDGHTDTGFSQPGLVKPGTHITQYVSGHDVTIGTNILYDTNDYTAQKLPSYKLVVVGADIYISKDVTELDGLYVAQPDAHGNGGHIYTCATNTGGAITGVNESGTYLTDCSNKLMVYGSFVAKRVYFLRTGGQLRNSVNDYAGSGNYKNTNAAETFYYSPEQWLGQQGTGLDTPDAITSLPPNL